MKSNDDPQILFDKIQDVVTMARNAGVIMSDEDIRDQYEMKLPSSIYTNCIEHAEAKRYRAQREAYAPTITLGANPGDPATVTPFVNPQITLEEFKDAIIDEYAKFKQLQNSMEPSSSTTTTTKATATALFPSPSVAA